MGVIVFDQCKVDTLLIPMTEPQLVLPTAYGLPTDESIIRRPGRNRRRREAKTDSFSIPQ